MKQKLHSQIFRYFLLIPLAVSCASIPKEAVFNPLTFSQENAPIQGIKTVSEDSPSSASYYHAIRGLQYEEERSPGSAGNHDRLALREYLAALAHDPNAVFLLKRIAVLQHRLGNLEDALFYAEKARMLYPSNYEVLLLLGDLYIASGDSEKGLQAYEQALALAPENSDTYFKIAGVFADRKDLKHAEEMIHKGIEASPPTPAAYYYLGRLGVEKGDLFEGLAYFRKALSLDPFFEPAHMEIAAIFERQRQEQAAINVYRNIVNRVNPGNHQAISRLVRLLIRTKAYDEALVLLDRLSEEDPSNLDISLQKTHVLVEKKAFSDAIQMLLPVVEAKPKDVRLKIYLASLYEENREVDHALAVYQGVLDQDPNVYDARIRLGYLYFYRFKNIDEALIQGELAKQLDPQRVESYLFTGLVLHDSERFEEAVEAFLEGLEMRPSLPDLHFHLGATFDKMNRFDDMVFEMEKAITLDAEHANALNYLGYTYADKGIELDKAIDLIKRALAVRPDDGYFIDSLGWAYYKKGMLQDAIDLLQKAVMSVPDDPVIHEHLGEVYLKNNRIELARKAWERSLELDPENNQLMLRYKEAGFGSPSHEKSLQKIKNPPPEVSSEALAH